VIVHLHRPSDTSPDLFDAEMKYLHDNSLRFTQWPILDTIIGYNRCCNDLGLTPEYQFLHYYDVKQYIYVEWYSLR